MTYISIKMCP